MDTSGEPLRYGLQAAPFLVKPNTDEATDITGIPISNLSSAQRAAAFFLDQGVTLVALSMGADGLLLAARERQHSHHVLLKSPCKRWWVQVMRS